MKNKLCNEAEKFLDSFSFGDSFHDGGIYPDFNSNNFETSIDPNNVSLLSDSPVFPTFKGSEGMVRDPFTVGNVSLDGKLEGTTPNPNQPKSLDPGQLLSSVIPAAKTLWAVKLFFDARREKRKQRNFENLYEQSEEKRRADNNNEYYRTPYLEEGGELMNFMNYYQSQQDNRSLTDKALQQYYLEKNNILKQNTSDMFNQAFRTGAEGVAGTLQTAMKVLSGGVMQDGGSLYSKDFNIDQYYQSQGFEPIPEEVREVQNKMEEDTAAMEWMFTPDTNVSTDEEVVSNVQSKQSNYKRAIDPYIESFGLTPSSVDTGKHRVGSKHFSGSAWDLGLNTSFGGDQKKMMNG